MRHTLAGVIVGVLLILAVILSAGTASLARFLDPVSLAIILGGIVSAGLVSFRASQIRAMMGAFRLIFRDDPSIDPEIAQLVKFASDYVKKDLRAAEQTIAQTASPFLKLGFQLVLDNTPLDDMMRILEWRIRHLKEDESSTARCFKSLGAAAPAFGMIGTLAGLIAMLADLKSADIVLISGNMALALTATFYGVVLAYLVFKPISLKLEQRTYRRVFMLHVLMDGLVLVRVGRGPAMIEDNLRHLLMENRDEVRGVD
jgi:chemotaxis protein MotA